MSDKTVLVVFPSIYSQKKIKFLMSAIKDILKIQNQTYSKIRMEESIVIVEATDPVLASAAINMLFGIEKVAIAKEIQIDFDSVLTNVTNSALSLLLKDENYCVKIEGKTKNFLAKDLEFAITTSIMENGKQIGVRPTSEHNYDKLVYAYLTNSYAYACIFLDNGLGGLPLYSQEEKILCCIYDELSAISCLQTIKMGFDVRIMICYSNEHQLLQVSKMMNKIIPRLVKKNVVIDTCKLNNASIMSTIITVTHLLTYQAIKLEIKKISLGISPMIFSAKFCEKNMKIVYQKNMVPWISLAGIDFGILQNSKEIGLDKFITNLHSLCKMNQSLSNVSMEGAVKSAKQALKTMKSVTITTGPNNVHDIMDAIKSNH